MPGQAQVALGPDPKPIPTCPCVISSPPPPPAAAGTQREAGGGAEETPSGGRGPPAEGPASGASWHQPGAADREAGWASQAGLEPSRSWQPREREEAGEGGVCVLSRLWSAPCSPELPTQSVCPRCCSEYMLSAGPSTAVAWRPSHHSPLSSRPRALPGSHPFMNPTGATWRTLLKAGFVSLLCGLRQWLGLSGQRDRHSRTIQPSPPLEET